MANTASLVMLVNFACRGRTTLIRPVSGLLFLPYWLMNAEETGWPMFVDRGEFTAHNQTMIPPA